jgi:DNA uptake protein ComE-like DNA-binding protein
MDSLQQRIVRLEDENQKRKTDNWYSQAGYPKPNYHSRKEITPFIFDPNSLEKAGWKRLGFSEKEAAMIIKYRDAGATFYKAEDLKRIYCISEDDYEKLAAYVKIDTSLFASDEKPYKSESFNKVIDLNKADTVDLLEIPGIGPFYARQILKYRDLLGGYVKAEQIREVYGLQEKYKALLPYLTAGPHKTRQINMNEARYYDFLKHPYIDKRLAYQITEYRRLKGDFKSLEQLKQLDELPDSVIQRLKPYLQFE